MPSSTLPGPRFADWERLHFASLVGGIVGLGLAIQLFIAIQTPTWTPELERVSGFVPVIVATLAYLRYRPSAPILEVCAVVVWGIIAQWIVFIGWFVAGPAMTGEASVSAALLSGVSEYRLRMLLQFLGTVTVFGGFYAAAASRHDRRVVSTAILLSVPIATVFVYAIV